MKRKYMVTLTIILSIICISACGKESQLQISLKPISIHDVYPGNLTDVNKLELVDGTTGQREVITLKDDISSILHEIKDIHLQPDRNQEGRVGYRFRIVLYENNEVKMDFTPNHIQGVYYEPNDELNSKIKRIFEAQFDREFR